MKTHTRRPWTDERKAKFIQAFARKRQNVDPSHPYRQYPRGASSMEPTVIAPRAVAPKSSWWMETPSSQFYSRARAEYDERMRVSWVNTGQPIDCGTFTVDVRTKKVSHDDSLVG